MSLGLIAGIGREMLLSRLLGTGPDIEYFRLAFAVPNLLATSLGVTLVSSMAALASGGGTDLRAAATVLRRLTTLALLVAIAVAGLGLASSPWIVPLLSPGYAESARIQVQNLMPGLWGYFAVVAAGFGLRSFLAVRGRTWVAASSSLVLSGAMALGLLITPCIAGRPPSGQDLVVLALISAVTLAVHHLLALRPTEWRGFWSGGRLVEPSARLSEGLLLFTAVLAHAVASAPRLVDRSIATEVGPGTVAAMDYSFAILTVPGVIFGTGLVTALVPAAAASPSPLNEATRKAALAWITGATLIGMVTGLVIARFAAPLVDVVYGGGRFDADSAQLTTALLSWHALALGPMIASILLMQWLLARNLALLVLLVAVARIAAKLAAVEWMVPRWGLDGLAASFLIPEITSALLLTCIVTARLSERFAR